MSGNGKNNGSRGHSDSGRAPLCGPSAVAPSGAGGAPSLATGGGRSGPNHAGGPGKHGQATGISKGPQKAQKSTNSNRRGGQQSSAKPTSRGNPSGSGNHSQGNKMGLSSSEEEAVDVTALVANFESVSAPVSDRDQEFRDAFGDMASPSAFDIVGDEFDQITATKVRPQENKGKRTRGSSSASAGSAGNFAAKKRMAMGPIPNIGSVPSESQAADPYADLDPPTRPPKRVKGSKDSKQALDSYSEATIRRLKLSIHSESRILRHQDYILIDHALQVQLFKRALEGESTPIPVKSGIRDGVIYIVAENQDDMDIFENLLKNMVPPTEDTPTDFVITRGDKAPTLKKMNCKVSNPFIGDHLDMLTVLLYRSNPTLKGKRLIIGEKIDRPFDKANTVVRCHVDLECMKALKELGWRAKLNMGHVDFWVPTSKKKRNSTENAVEMTDAANSDDGAGSAPTDGAAGQMDTGAPGI